VDHDRPLPGPDREHETFVYPDADAGEPTPAPDVAPPPPPDVVPPANHAPLPGPAWLAIGLALGFLAGFAVGTRHAAPDPPPDRAPTPTTRAPAPTTRAPTPRAPEDGPPVPVLTSRVAGPALVNVWLQGCADCMPKFEAWSRLVAAGRIPRGLAVHNVAYGDATRDYAARYHVEAGLAADRGGVYVQPLGIHTFTTLLVDEAGRVTDRLDPTDARFVDRVGQFAEEHPRGR
jgi:hypothetical protein